MEYYKTWALRPLLIRCGQWGHSKSSPNKMLPIVRGSHQCSRKLLFCMSAIHLSLYTTIHITWLLYSCCLVCHYIILYTHTMRSIYNRYIYSSQVVYNCDSFILWLWTCVDALIISKRHWMFAYNFFFFFLCFFPQVILINGLFWGGWKKGL